MSDHPFQSSDSQKFPSADSRPADEPATPTESALPRAPMPGSFTPRVRPISLPGEPAPVGASLARPVPAPLPDRGAALFFFINLVAAIIAVSFTVLLALKL